MKKFTKIIAVAICICAILSIASCATYKGKIEAIEVLTASSDDIKSVTTIYRAKVKEIQLYNADSEDKNTLFTTTEYKYTYFSEDPFFTEYDYNWNENMLKQHFPTHEFDGRSCKDYDCTVGVKVIIDGVDKVYRPGYTIKNGIITVEFYSASYVTGNNFLSDSDLEGMCFKQEYDYAEFSKGLKVYKDMKDIDMDELFKKYKYTAGIFQDKISFNADNIILAISYHM